MRRLAIKHLGTIGYCLDHIGQMNWNLAYDFKNEQFPKDLKHISTQCKTLRSKTSSATEKELVEISSAVQHYLTVFNSGIAQQNLQDLDKITILEKPLEEIVEQNDILVQIMSKKAEEAGLTIWNKLIRKYDDFAVRFNLKKNIKRTFEWGLAAYLTNSLFQSDIVEVANWGKDIAIKAKKQVLGSKKINIDLGEFFKDAPKLALAKSTGLTAMAATQVGEDVKDMFNWTLEKIAMAYKYLKGGHYLMPVSRAIKPIFSFKHLVGYSFWKAEYSKVKKFLKNPDFFVRAGLPIPRGYIFAGPTNSSKGFFAHCVTGEINEYLESVGQKGNFRLMEVHASEILRDNGLEKIFHDARKYAPCVLFIREIELLGLAGKNDLTAKLFDEVEKTIDRERKKQIIVIASTNKPSSIDVTLRQKDRLTKTLRFYKPSFEERKEFFEKALSLRNLNPEEFDLDSLANDTVKFSFGKINAYVNKVLIKAKGRGIPITQELFDYTFDQKIRYIITRKPTIPQHEISIIAACLAAQAVVHTALDAEGDLTRVTISGIFGSNPKRKDSGDLGIEYGKIFIEHGEDHCGIGTGAEAVKKAKRFLAGALTQKLLVGTGSTYNLEQKEDAYKIAQGFATEGIEMANFSKEQKIAFNAKAWEYYKQWEKEAEELVKQYEPSIRAIAKELEKKYTLKGSDVRTIMEKSPKVAL